MNKVILSVCVIFLLLGCAASPHVDREHTYELQPIPVFELPELPELPEPPEPIAVAIYLLAQCASENETERNFCHERAKRIYNYYNEQINNEKLKSTVDTNPK